MFPKKTKKIYLIGIKGTGMSSLAVLLKKLGYHVSGSDTAEHFFTESQLKKNHIVYRESYSAKHIQNSKPDLVIYSTAYNERNSEVSEAKMLGIPILSYPQVIGEISARLSSVAICGSHGKTTTTSMLGWIMQSNGRTATLTGTVADKLNVALKRPKYFIFEADEYQNKLALYSPANVILINVDFDHPDYFKNSSHYNSVFLDFAARILKRKGYVLYNHDNAAARTIFKKLKKHLPASRQGVSYGFDDASDFRITDTGNDLDSFTLSRNGKKLTDIRLKVYGKHNILNAAAAAIMALHLGIKLEVVRYRLALFTGVKRRMEIIHSKKYLIVDDYGHHPTEIQATLSALRHKYPKKKIVTVFHPHTFTRTKALKKEFGKSFKDSNLTIVLDIYPSAREITGGISSKELMQEIKRNNTKAIYIPTIPETAKYIKSHISPGSLILTIGAGDVWKLTKMIK